MIKEFCKVDILKVIVRTPVVVSICIDSNNTCLIDSKTIFFVEKYNLSEFNSIEHIKEEKNFDEFYFKYKLYLDKPNPPHRFTIKGFKHSILKVYFKDSILPPSYILSNIKDFKDFWSLNENNVY